MQAGQSESTKSEMVDAVGERLEGILKIAESDPKIGPLDRLPELERQLGLDQEEIGRGNDDDEEEEEADEDEEEEAGENEEEEEEFEFSFPCGNPNSSPIAAEDAFHNGQIRPTFPVFDQSLLADVIDSDEPAASSSSSLHQPVRKLFTEGSATVSASIGPEEECCVWEGRTVEEIPAALRQKSNSTGSSRLRRFRDFVHRSSSDGRDAFVFLNPTAEKDKAAKGGERREEKAPAAARGGGKGKKAAAAAAPALLYGRNKAAEKRRSYLPYRPGLVGFFTNVNGLTKNVHPY